MDSTTALMIIGVIYGVLLFFDNFFKTCAHYPYIKFLEDKPLSLKWKTKALNRTLIRWGNSRPRFLHVWFTVGLYASLVLLPIAIILLVYSLIQNVFGSSGESKVVLEPIVPGINLPASELGYYSLTLIVCSIVHELGHALAAVLEDVNLIDVGANIWFILPVAYVNLSTEKFSSLSHKRILKILCGGIWHNLVLSLIAFILFNCLPFIFTPFYYTNKGVTVSHMTKHSPLSGSRGLNVGDTIFNINECSVFDEASYFECLQYLQQHKSAFCIDSDLIHSLDESIPLKHLENGYMGCCDSGKPLNLCFEYMDTADGILELPSHVCLPGRTVVEKSTNFCTHEPHSCQNNFYCFRPLLANSTNLFKIVCDGKNVIYLGLAMDFYRTVDVSAYIRSAYLLLQPSPDVLTKFFKLCNCIFIWTGNH
ncbi:hypothetical protein NQ318_000219 [Aromia moschata]|uniref:Membrane-bound transcription factor site-2 protease n=1 Tax=Aromia moschata TaxID=1265417 RepID=A0AAV8YLT5_9CUCU|nr:hypothetical protein NQ318_000219 [Aromia moschata]